MENQELQLITQRFDAVTMLMNSQFKGINDRLDKINGRVGKTEDEIQLILVEKAITTEKQKKGLKELDELYVRVDEIDNKERNHVTMCPVVPKLGDIDKRVRNLEDSILANISRKSLIKSALATVAVLIGIMIGSLQINEMLRINETTKIMQQSDSILLNQIIIYETAKEIRETAKEKKKAALSIEEKP
jgi:hypothetical protein